MVENGTSKSEVLEEVADDIAENLRQESLKIQHLYRYLKIHTQIGKIPKDDEPIYAIAFTEISLNELLRLLAHQIPLVKGEEGKAYGLQYSKIIGSALETLKNQGIDAEPQITLIHDQDNQVTDVWAVSVPYPDFDKIKQFAMVNILEEDLSNLD